jgi:SAM-dependent methyltransferase
MSEPEGAPLELDNPLLVRWEYASEERLAVRNAVQRNLVEGVAAEDLIVNAVRERRPARVLEVGCGTGELAVRIRDEVGTDICAVDVSERMVALAREKGVPAEVEDVQSLSFDDDTFDCVVAGWVLYHLRDLDIGLREIVRVLRPGGRLVAATVGEGNLGELWKLVAAPPSPPLRFGSANGEDVLRRHFPRVERRDARGTVVFEDAAAARTFVAASITRAHLAERVPELPEPLRVSTYHVVFVADAA